MQKVLPFCLLLFALHSVAQTVSPSTINTGGGSQKVAPGFVVDWSIGESSSIETYYVENANPNSYIGRYYNITSGVLQPFDNVHVIVNPNIPEWTIYEVHFSPVPAADNLTIDFKSNLNGKLSIQMLAANGRLVEQKELTMANSTATVAWDLSKCISGIYFFRIVLTSTEGKILKQRTFEIEKIK